MQRGSLVHRSERKALDALEEDLLARAAPLLRDALHRRRRLDLIRGLRERCHVLDADQRDVRDRLSDDHRLQPLDVLAQLVAASNSTTSAEAPLVVRMFVGRGEGQVELPVNVEGLAEQLVLSAAEK